jgi:transposase-like protein
MDPQKQWCHNPDCPARGQMGQGNIHIHSYKEQRYRCWICRQTFAATKGTPFYRLRTAADLVTLVLVLLCHGCPLQAIVAAFGLDERTVGHWQARAGRHCQKAHGAMVQQGRVDLGHVQADELWVKLVGKRVWMAMALAVPSRLWLGGVISQHRDRRLITDLVRKVRACAANLAILVCVDGLASYVTAFMRVFRHTVRTGRRGRPRLVVEPGLLIGQVIKRYAKRRVVGVVHRVVRGTAEAIAEVLSKTRTGTVINTAYIERLNATFRSALAPLARRGRAIAHLATTLTAGMYLVGCAYNFCWCHRSLRLPAAQGSARLWSERTPAMAAGLTDHPWKMAELLHYQVPLPPWVPPKQRGRPPGRIQSPLIAGAP